MDVAGDQKGWWGVSKVLQTSTDGPIKSIIDARVALEKAEALAKKEENKWIDFLNRIEHSFSSDVLAKAACIVWWDFFSSRQALKAWKDLDKYKDQWRNDMVPNMKSVKDCLVAFGYEKAKAQKRCGLKIETKPESPK